MHSQIEIYQSADGHVAVDVTFQNETVWLNRHQIALLFNRDVKTIGKHINNVFDDGELEKRATVAKFATVQTEGEREVERKIEHYNLDVIISVGYRVKSQRGVQFRQWATQRLKDYLLEGYAINQRRLAQKQQEVYFLKSGLQILSRAIEEKAGAEGAAWLQPFAAGLTLLDDYDHERLDTRGQTRRPANYPSRAAYQRVIDDMRAEFDSAVFGLEKDQSFESAIMQITKGFGEEDFYPSLEEKAAMLLYLIVKNHAFADGNKRIAAACFLLFLRENDMLRNERGGPIISHEALAGLTLFVAASKPEEMPTVRNLIVSVLNRNRYGGV